MRGGREAHPDRRIALWFMDEARFGQKGRTTHRWWMRGPAPAGRCDKRFESAYIFAAVRPSTGEDFALVLPRVSSAAMSAFLAGFAATVPTDTPRRDGSRPGGLARGHGPRRAGLLTLVPLPSYSPELNPVERIWLYLRER